ncbi:related to cel1 protein precursor [Serendipita indica DSM 11827]|uniref:AA9 family lytic polysaccharide monooxygenase n=1 Tax=Serendipita indica (strain DSM 11827) TaxID=1109443 RepID=G4T8M4_SERID|nr:related to cel1 protein precursor [Serendipita indica DSM 11827]
MGSEGVSPKIQISNNERNVMPYPTSPVQLRSLLSCPNFIPAINTIHTLRNKWDAVAIAKCEPNSIISKLSSVPGSGERGLLRGQVGLHSGNQRPPLLPHRPMLAKALAPVLFATAASAHAIFQELYVNGVSAGHNTGIRVPTYNGPITDVTSNDIICNGGINPLATPLPSAIINVPAGATLTAEWHHGGNGADPSDASDPIDPSHKGPLMAYLAKVDNALTTTVTGLKWFKIYEDGLTGTTWAVDKMIANKGKHSFTVPSCIPPGNYLLRVELIALHGASSYPGAQFYMECAQINITGGGSASPPTVSFPGAYSGSDPGILVK